MMNYKIRAFMLVCFLLTVTASFSQNGISGYTWWDPAGNSFPVVEGRGWSAELKGGYDRLPQRAHTDSLNPNVWNLSQNSAGLYLQFTTDAGSIVVRYAVRNKGSLAMNHMPATGVSGVDLYSIDHNGNWGWAPGTFSFGDTIEYRFSNLQDIGQFAGRERIYRLYLPLYNGVQWMQVGVPAGKGFAPLPLSKDLPIVVYGTSIAQGACATRPGLAWTAVLNRALDRPVINLGFSGNGRLEKPVIDLVNELDASLYVLDCLPNLTRRVGFTDAEAGRRIRASVKGLQERHPSTPILLVEHSGGYAPGMMDTARDAEYEKVNRVLRDCYAAMLQEGVRNIYLLSNADIGLDIDATVDGLHPNDIGMVEHGRAYEKIIRKILREPVGNESTTRPVEQGRDDNYNWLDRHDAVLALNKARHPRSVILGNSIIHFWGGEPAGPIARGAAAWTKYMEPLGIRNLGFGWDRIENVLWRVYHGELDGFEAEKVVLMIGTNNLSDDNDDTIITGLKLLVDQIILRQPHAKLYLSGILPRRQMEPRIDGLNKRIASLSALLKVIYIQPGRVLLNKEGRIDESLFEEGLHPDAKGYERLGAALSEDIKK